MKKKTIGKEYIFTALILFVVLAVTMALDSQLPSYHIVIKGIMGDKELPDLLRRHTKKGGGEK